MREQIDREVFISRQSRNFFVEDIIIKVFVSFCTLTWSVSNHISSQGKGKNRRNENIIIDDPYYQFFIQLTVSIATCWCLEEPQFVVLSNFINEYKTFPVFTTV